jgi:hypothetical protein
VTDNIVPRRFRLASRTNVAAAAAVLAVVAGVTTFELTRPALPPRCTVPRIGATGVFGFDPEQTQDASIVAAVGTRLGLPDHAVTIALAASLGETQLRNLDHGDLDSLGLFQQRPSQGWGTSAQIMDPSYASSAFYAHLVKVPGWQTMAVTDAAQRVQHSATPEAYAAWESRARALAQAFTAEIPAGVSCTLRFFEGPPPRARTLGDVAASEFGPRVLGVDLAANLGWRVAAWTVAHAYRYHIDSVTFDGRRWSRGSGRWSRAPVTRSVVEVAQRTSG